MFKINFADGSHILVNEYPDWESISVKGIYVTSIVYKVNAADFSSVDTIKGYFGDETKTSAVDLFRVNDEDETIQTKLDSVEGYTKLQRIVMDDNDVIRIYMIKGTTIPEIVNELNEKIRELEKALENKEKSIDSMSLDELKEYKVKESKSVLNTWLEDSYVESDVHGGTIAKYSITSTKQQQLASVIELAKSSSDFTPYWNARGEVATYDWTVDELVALAVIIQNKVRPQVDHQQELEKQILAATTKEEVLGINISYGND